MFLVPLGFHGFPWVFIVSVGFSWSLTTFGVLFLSRGKGSQNHKSWHANFAKGPCPDVPRVLGPVVSIFTSPKPKLTVMTKNKRTSETFGDNVPVSGGNLLR